MNFDHGAFQVSDMDEAIEFYTKKLCFTLSFRGLNEEEQEAYAFLECGNARLEIIQDLTKVYEKPPIQKPYCPHFCIEVANMEQALEKLKQNNVQIVRGPLKIEGEETWVYFSDLDNNILEYIEWYTKKT